MSDTEERCRYCFQPEEAGEAFESYTAADGKEIKLHSDGCLSTWRRAHG